MRNEATIEIDRPIEDVFRLANEHIAEWSIVVIEDEVINETPDGVGTTFRSVTEDQGKRMEFQGVVTRYDPPYLNAVTLKNNVLHIETEFQFEDLSGRTRVTQTAEVKGKGFYKPMMFVFGLFMKKSSCDASHNELESLKSYCEKNVAATTV